MTKYAIYMGIKTAVDKNEPCSHGGVYVSGIRETINQKVYLALNTNPLCGKHGFLDGKTYDYLTFDNEWDLVDFLDSNYNKMRELAWEKGLHYSIEALGEKLNMSADAWDEALRYLSNANLTKDEMEKERVKRLKELKLEPYILNEAIKNKTMVISESMGLPWGVNFVLHGYTYEEEVKKAMKMVERYGGLPYFAVVNHLVEGGLWISVLYVSKEKSCWSDEHMEKEGNIFAGVYDTNQDTIDLGYVKLKLGAGGVRRIE